jgi:signal transduction histidine kinase
VQGQGIIKFVNPTLLQIFGNTQPSDIVGTRFSEYILPGDIPAAKWRQQQLMAGATLPAFWFNCIHTNGQIFKALTSSTVIEWDGEPHILSCMTPPSDSAMLLQEVESVKTRYEGLLARQLEAQQINIAHELHDSLGSQLACISLQAASVEQVSSDSHAQRVELARLQENISKAAGITRNLARGLMPVDAFPGSFWRALERLCNDFNNAPALRCRFEMLGDFDAINVEVGTHLYRIAQEAITNALRHGHATHIVVRLELAGQDRILSITDNGSGFDPTTVQHTPGVGLGSIYARAGAIGAQVALAKQTPRGFCVEVRYTDASVTVDL